MSSEFAELRQKVIGLQRRFFSDPCKEFFKTPCGASNRAGLFFSRAYDLLGAEKPVKGKSRIDLLDPDDDIACDKARILCNALEWVLEEAKEEYQNFSSNHIDQMEEILSGALDSIYWDVDDLNNIIATLIDDVETDNKEKKMAQSVLKDCGTYSNNRYHPKHGKRVYGKIDDKVVSGIIICRDKVIPSIKDGGRNRSPVMVMVDTVRPRIIGSFSPVAQALGVSQNGWDFWHIVPGEKCVGNPYVMASQALGPVKMVKRGPDHRIMSYGKEFDEELIFSQSQIPDGAISLDEFHQRIVEIGEEKSPVEVEGEECQEGEGTVETVKTDSCVIRKAYFLQDRNRLFFSEKLAKFSADDFNTTYQEVDVVEEDGLFRIVGNTKFTPEDDEVRDYLKKQREEAGKKLEEARKKYDFIESLVSQE